MTVIAPLVGRAGAENVEHAGDRENAAMAPSDIKDIYDRLRGIEGMQSAFNETLKGVGKVVDELNKTLVGEGTNPGMRGEFRELKHNFQTVKGEHEAMKANGCYLRGQQGIQGVQGVQGQQGVQGVEGDPTVQVTFKHWDRLKAGLLNAIILAALMGLAKAFHWIN